MPRIKPALLVPIAALLACGPGGVCMAAAEQLQDDNALPEIPQDVVSFDAAFFDLYQPTSALEMLRQIPGFRLDDGDDKRGFGAAAGNVLINDR
jgi:hypothetical protein